MKKKMVGLALGMLLVVACGGAVVVDETTTTLASTTTSTTAAPTTTVAVAGKSGAPTDPNAVNAVHFYETAPMGTDLTCRGLAFELTWQDQVFDPANAAFVKAAIKERAVREGCPIS